MSYVFPVALVFNLSLIGCMGSGSDTPQPAPQGEQPAPVAPEPKEEPSAADRTGYVIGVTSLRKVTSEDKKIPDPDGSGKQVSNWVATLYRGEEVTVFGEDGDWMHCRLSDGSEGWMKNDRLVAGPDVKVATIYEDGKVFKRPNLLSLDGDKTIPAGSLVFVLQEKEQFSEVDFPRSGFSSSRAWTLTSELVNDPSEIEVAKVVMKVLHMRSQGDKDAKQLEDLARSQFGSSRLVSLLDQPAEPTEGEGEGEGAPEGGGE